MSQPIIEVIPDYGPDKRTFYIHENLLHSCSPTFRESLEASEDRKPLILHQVSAETFATFSRWVYTKELVVDELEYEDKDTSGSERSCQRFICDRSSSERLSCQRSSSEQANGDDQRAMDSLYEVSEHGDRGRGRDKSASTPPATTNGKARPGATNGTSEDDEGDLEHPKGYSKLNSEGRVFVRLVNLYKFAIDFGAPTFKRRIMIEWQRWCSKNEIVPCSVSVRHLLNRVDVASQLCQYVILCWACSQEWQQADKAKDANLSPRFLVEVLVLALRESQDDDVVSGQRYWCRFHEHENDEEKEQCEESREDDYDMELKRRDSRPMVRRFGGCC